MRLFSNIEIWINNYKKQNRMNSTETEEIIINLHPPYYITHETSNDTNPNSQNPIEQRLPLPNVSAI